MAAPTLAAAACPRCYGLQRIDDGLFVDAAMDEPHRHDLQAEVAAAEATLTGFFGTLEGRYILLACGDEACEDRLAGSLEGTARVRAFAYDAGALTVIRLSPRGQSATIVTHELAHAQVHARIGFLNHMLGVFPAWFDEGLATLISDDRRYFKPGPTAAARCLPTPDAALPTRPLAWGAMAGPKPWIYAKATCAVMLWMERNGGREGVLAALARVAAGERFVP